MIKLLAPRVRLSPLALLAAAACATGAGAAPARLADPGAENVRALTDALGHALGRARVELGAADLATATAIPVLPPPPGPYETRSLAEPVIFDLEIEGGTCRAVRRDTGEVVPLPGVRCRAAG
ncbi:MAG: hypothetical protein U5J99_12440 [Parvularculaceae bacterium]|nr:hypothetical protein [Parvularculaceae bacterium]